MAERSNPLTWLRGSLGGWTQARLAAELGISEASVSRIEAGKARIGAKTAVALWEKFGPRLAGRGYSQLGLLTWEPGGDQTAA